MQFMDVNRIGKEKEIAPRQPARECEAATNLLAGNPSSLLAQRLQIPA